VTRHEDEIDLGCLPADGMLAARCILDIERAHTMTIAQQGTVAARINLA
jgi:hypothetical protein